MSDHMPTCPHCAELLDAGTKYRCPHCDYRIDALPKSRERSFCRYCGALTKHPDSCCEAHRALLLVDSAAGEDVAFPLVNAAPKREDTQARKGKAV